MPRPKLDPSYAPPPAAAPAAPADEAPQAAPQPPPPAPVAATPEPTGPAITALCEDSFEETISGLGDDAALVLFLASEYSSSKQQLAAFERFIAAADYTGMRFFSVEVNACARLMMSQKVSRVPAINLYQRGTLLGSISMLNNVMISDAELEELIAQAY